MNIEFVDYTGSYPNLCSGLLTLKVNGKLYELANVLCSGGSVWFDDGREEHGESGEWHVERGKWEIDTYKLPEELKPFCDEIARVVNENVEHGCCGGCV